MNKRIIFVFFGLSFLMVGCKGDTPTPEPIPTEVNVVLDGDGHVLVNDKESYSTFTHSTSEKLERTFKISDEEKELYNFKLPPTIEVFTKNGQLKEGQDYFYNLIGDKTSASFTMNKITEDIRVVVSPFIEYSTFVANLNGITGDCSLSFKCKVNSSGAKLYYEGEKFVDISEKDATTFKVLNPTSLYTFYIVGDVDEIDFNYSGIDHTKFYNRKIQEVIFSSYVRNIPSNSFNSFANLKLIAGGYNVTKIGEKAFYDSYNLDEFDFTSFHRINEIGNQAFNSSNANNKLALIDMNKYNFVPKLGTDVFCTAPKDFKIILNKDMISQFKTAENWSNYANKMVTPSAK